MNATLSTVLAVLSATLFWLSVIGLVRVMHSRAYTIGPVILLWAMHVAIFWTVSAVRRLFFGYVGPSVPMTYWGTIIYLQAALSILGMLYLARRRLRP